MITRVPVETDFNYDIPSKYNVVKTDFNYNTSSNGVMVRKPRSSSGIVRKTVWMLAVNEFGIYEALFASRRLEARQFRLWSATVIQKLRKQVGLQQYEVMKMTDPEIQEEINHILDTLFYNPETGQLMQSVTVQGGDVEQVPFEI